MAADRQGRRDPGLEPGRQVGSRPRPSILVLAATALFAVQVLHYRTYLLDDAYISLRYAHNLAEGNGPVWNVGERVEGYTNLLWTLLLAALMSAGLDPARSAELPGLLCYAALALLENVPLTVGLVTKSDRGYALAERRRARQPIREALARMRAELEAAPQAQRAALEPALAALERECAAARDDADLRQLQRSEGFARAALQLGRLALG